MSWALVRASAYLVDTGEDGHESAEDGCTDAGNVDKRTLKDTDKKQEQCILQTCTGTVVCRLRSLN